MKFTTLLFGLTLGLFSLTVIAGSGHDHGHGHSHAPVDQATAKVMASKIITSFVKQKTIDESWLSVTDSTVEKKVFNGQQEWVVSFVNEKISDAKKRKLYVFLSLSGDYVAANYTGK
ncbi:MAG: DUF6488 family protein [Gammaproteobacteria bacterium]|nr:DUF6488 family protein [Gammaproteobacteria bacterium]